MFGLTRAPADVRGDTRDVVPIVPFGSGGPPPPGVTGLLVAARHSPAYPSANMG